MTITRFAPSPTGRLHLGHAYSAIVASRSAGASGRFLVRIDDLDQARSRVEFEAGILEDLSWLGLAFELPMRRQSDHLAEYDAALLRLVSQGLTYPCFCTRGQITAEILAAGGAPQGPDGPIYPGICRDLSPAQIADNRTKGLVPAIRLDVQKTVAHVGDLSFVEHGRVVSVSPGILGDVVLARRDQGAAYHLAVVVDDAAQNVDIVTRGEDLVPATHVQRLLQAALGISPPHYAHHRLIRDADGQRLAKRADSLSLASLRAQGVTPDDIFKRLGLDL